MKKKFFLKIVMLFVNMSFLNYGQEFYKENIYNENSDLSKIKVKTTKVKFKVVPSLNVIVVRDENKNLKKVEIKGRAAKDTLIKVSEKEIRIIASCDNYKW